MSREQRLRDIGSDKISQMMSGWSAAPEHRGRMEPGAAGYNKVESAIGMDRVAGQGIVGKYERELSGIDKELEAKKKDAAEKKKTAQDFADELAKSHPIKPDDSEPVDVESEVVETESAYDRHSNNIRNAWTEFMDEADKDSIDKMIKMFRDRIKDMQKRRGS